MPVSKNRRKSKKGQTRKENRAKAGNYQGGGGIPYEPEYSLPQAHNEFPGLRTIGTSIGGGRRYSVTSPPDDPNQTEMGQIDAIVKRSVTFEMTEAYHDNIGLREIDLDGEMGGDFLGPMVATVNVDPLTTIEGHPLWTTGQELIDFLDADPNVFRDEFDGNRWQGSGARWDECPPSVLDCPYRLVDQGQETAPGCVQCEAELPPEEVHFHILDSDSILTLCQGCWSKGPLPEEDRTLGAKFSG